MSLKDNHTLSVEVLLDMVADFEGEPQSFAIVPIHLCPILGAQTIKEDGLIRLPMLA